MAAKKKVTQKIEREPIREYICLGHRPDDPYTWRDVVDKINEGGYYSGPSLVECLDSVDPCDDGTQEVYMITMLRLGVSRKPIRTLEEE